MKEKRVRPVSEQSIRFGKNTRYLMDMKGVSLDRLVDAIGVSKGNLSRIVSGQSEVPLATAMKLAEYFNKELVVMANGRVEL